MNVRRRKLRTVSGAALGRRRKRTWACLECGAVLGSPEPKERSCRFCGGRAALFDSHREAVRWDQLVQLQKRGRISDLERQKRFELVPAKHAIDGEAVHYVADFIYRLPPPLSGTRRKIVIEDVKGGAMTPLARLKLSLLRMLLDQAYGSRAEVRVVE